MTDVWVCSTCSSINRQRNSRCYKCGGPQSAATSGVLADVRTERAIEARAYVAYRSSLLRAFVAAAFIVAVAVLGVVLLIESLGVVQYIRDEIPGLLQTGQIDQAELIRRASGAFIPALLRQVCAIGAILFFAAWLSRVIMNVPALGGGTPGATPTRAFLYPLIPIWNLFKTPAIVQDALYRLDPKAGGFFMLLVAWIGLVGSAIASFIVGWWVDLRIATVVPRAQTLGEAIAVFEGAYDMQFLVDVITTLMVSFGAIVLVLIMFRIESRAAARDREIRQAAFAPRPEPGTVAARPGALSYEAAAGLKRDTAVPGATAAAAAAAGATAAPAAGSPEPVTPRVTPPVADPVQERSALAATGRPEPTLFTDAGKRRQDDEVVPIPPDGSDLAPRLIVAVDGRDGIRAELDGESEPITLDDLRSAAVALARSGGSAVVTTTTDSADARWTARDVAAALRDSGVPTTYED